MEPAAAAEPTAAEPTAAEPAAADGASSSGANKGEEQAEARRVREFKQLERKLKIQPGNAGSWG